MKAAVQQANARTGPFALRQHIESATPRRDAAASAAIMHGEPAPMRKMLDELIREP